MIRRRRRPKEIAFSFDSFLDVVANVVGIIIRLILVVWVGARSYHTLQEQPESAAPRPVVIEDLPLPPDPLQAELEKHKLELAQMQARLAEQLKHLESIETERKQVERELAATAFERREAQQLQVNQEGALAGADQNRNALSTSLEEMRRRSRELVEEIRALEKLPALTKTLRYRTPVSKPLQAEEFMFECKAGRVAFIDIGAMLAEVKRGFDDKAELLKTQWQVADATGPVGAFQLRYVVERERGTLDGLSAGGPHSGSSYRYGLSEWRLEPVVLMRGETLEQALQPDSEFRRVTDSLDVQQAAVTFWVYPDSFAVFRRLRDHLYERDLVVAGRPLPDGVSIMSSRRGSVSRGQ